MISILYPTLNNLDFLTLACRSVEENTTIPFEIVIWDNGSTEDIRDFARNRGYTYLSSETNIGLSIPTNRMVAAAKHDVVMISDNDTVLLPGWDSIVGELTAGARWRLPMQIRPDRPSRAIIGYYGSDPGNFQMERLLFHHAMHTAIHIYPHRHRGTFLGLPVLWKEDYLAIGGFNEDFFCSEQQFLWEASQYYDRIGALQLTCPTSWYYHFGGSTVRPAGYGKMIADAKEFCRIKHGLNEEQMDATHNHFAIYGPSIDQNGVLIEYK